MSYFAVLLGGDTGRSKSLSDLLESGLTQFRERLVV
jgi:hypothetical protein